MNRKLKVQSKGFYLQCFRASPMLKFLNFLSRFLYIFHLICLQFFFSGNFSRQEEQFLQTNVQKILKRGSSAYSCM